MTDQYSKVPVDSGASPGIQLASLLTNMMGTTETTTTNPSSGAMAGSNQVLSQALSTSTNPQDALVNNILQQSAIKFAPTLSQGLGGSGLYNNTTLQLMQNDAQGQAVAQSASAVLQAQQSALQTAANVSNAQLNASKTTKAVQKPNVMSMLTQAIPGVLVGALAKKLGVGDLADKAFQSVSDLLSPASTEIGNPIASGSLTQLGANQAFGVTDAAGNVVGSSADFSALDASSVAAGELSTGVGSTVAGGITADVAPTVEEMAAGAEPMVAQGLDGVAGNGTASISASDMLASAPTDVGSTVASGLDASSAGAGTASDIGGALGEGDISSAAISSDIGSGIAADTGAGIAADAGAGVAADVGAGIADAGAADAGGSALGDLAVAASVICTELYRQGKMTPWEYSVELALAAKKLSPEAVAGYHYWGIPYTRLMARSAVATTFITPFARAWAAKLRGEKTLLGDILYSVGVPICEFIGRQILREGVTDHG